MTKIAVLLMIFLTATAFAKTGNLSESCTQALTNTGKFERFNIDVASLLKELSKRHSVDLASRKIPGAIFTASKNKNAPDKVLIPVTTKSGQKQNVVLLIFRETNVDHYTGKVLENRLRIEQWTMTQEGKDVSGLRLSLYGEGPYCEVRSYDGLKDNNGTSNVSETYASYESCVQLHENNLESTDIKNSNFMLTKECKELGFDAASSGDMKKYHKYYPRPTPFQTVEDDMKTYVAPTTTISH